MRVRRIVAGLVAVLAAGVVFVWLARFDIPKAHRPSASAASHTNETPAIPAGALVEQPASRAASPPTDAPSLRTLRGQVIDAATRAPVQAFEVALQARGTGAVTRTSRRFQSDDGRFEWPALRRGYWMIAIQAPGYQLFELDDLDMPAVGARELTVPMRRGAVVRGRVIDEATGAGIGGALLWFRDAELGRFEGNWRNRPRIETARDGSFVADILPPGRVTVDVWAQGYASVERSFVARDTSSLEIAMSSGGSISGRLTAADGATPVAGTVALFDTDRGFGSSSRTTGVGEFVYPNLPPGRYRLSGRHGNDAADPREIVLARGQHLDGIVLALKPGGVIRGTVLGLRPDERRMANVTVRPMDATAPPALVESVFLDADGAYELRGVGPGEVRVVAQALTRGEISKTVFVAAGAELVVDLEYPTGFAISGRVTRAGQPVPGARVRAAHARSGEEAGMAMADAGGAYRIEGLAAGEYRVRTSGSRPQQLFVAADTVVDLVIADARLTGRVLETSGKVPVVGAHVELWLGAAPLGTVRFQDRTDHIGHFELVGVEAGDHLLTVYRPGYEMQRTRIAYPSSEAEITLRLRADPGVALRITGAEPGAPIDELLVEEMLPKGAGIRLQLHADDGGTVHLPAGLAGQPLRFSADGYAPVVIPTWDGQPLEVRLNRQR